MKLKNLDKGNETVAGKSGTAPASSNFHIDDGCMGGGTSISHIAPINFDPIAGNDNDFYDVKWGNGWDVNGNNQVDIGTDNLHGNFNVNRLGIFHYCIMGHEYADFPGSSGKAGGIPVKWFIHSNRR